MRVIELETAKEIQSQVFGARPGEGEEMIQRRRRRARKTMSSDILVSY
ncbi:MAG: hypothetical protein M0Q47_01365 [Methanothrix sp.]|nr:hypothetical protein [Methanothrix sp.]MCK9405049.1 hypothetical protein [Methanothrix sp.]